MLQILSITERVHSQMQLQNFSNFLHTATEGSNITQISSHRDKVMEDKHLRTKIYNGVEESMHECLYIELIAVVIYFIFINT